MMTERKTADLTPLTNTLESLLELEKKKRQILEKELEGMPEGNLCITPRNGQTYYQCAIKGHRTGITRDINLVYKLARKRYLQVLLGEHEEMLHDVHCMTKSPKIIKSIAARKPSKLEKILDRYGKAGLAILRITCSEKQYQWAMAKYRKCAAHPEELKFETYSGIIVRSKSEQRIGNALEVRGIPYRYEPEVRLQVRWMEGVIGMDSGGYKSYYPDFLIPTVTGEVIIWEHLGRVDREGYRAHNMEKIAAYRQNGTVDDDHLILSFEKDMEKTETLDQLIARRVLPFL